MSASASGALLALLGGLAVAAPAAEVSVEVWRRDDVLHVAASASLDAGLERAWQVLTDYGRFAEFVPDLHVSRVVGREGNRVEVEQKGEARLLFYTFPIDVRLEVIEHPRSRIVARSIAGNFREMLGAYFLESAGGRVELRYAGRIVPDFFVPPIIGTLALRRSIESSFGALVEEIERGEPTGHPAK